MRTLEASRGVGPGVAYPLKSTVLPFLLRYAHRRCASNVQAIGIGATQSDGSTTSNDSQSGGNEEFDWLDDD